MAAAAYEHALGDDVATGYAADPALLTAAHAVDASDESWSGGAGAAFASARDLAAWDDAFFGGRILPSEAVQEMTTPAALPDGSSTHYGYGWFVRTLYDEPEIWHGGLLSGYGAVNAYFPRRRLAIVLLVNAYGDYDRTVRAIYAALYPPTTAQRERQLAGEPPKTDDSSTEIGRRWYEAFRTGRVDPTNLTAGARGLLTGDVTHRTQDLLIELGEPQSFELLDRVRAHGYIFYTYRIRFVRTALRESITLDHDGRAAIVGFFPDSPGTT
jgi:CubicO group peptidase (beta-lactamase class C family)